MAESVSVRDAVKRVEKESNGLEREPEHVDAMLPAKMVPRETANAHDLPNPEPDDFQHRQLQLFQSFVANTDRERDRLSNAFDLWDSVPRYSVSRLDMAKSRVADKFLEPLRLNFQHRGRGYTCVISPAYVTDLDGEGRYFYPSASEELVEDALRRLAVEKQAGYFDQRNRRSGVQFSLYELRQEMGKRGHARSYPQIVQSLNILSHSVVDLIADEMGEARITSPCLASLAAVSRQKLREDPDARWAVQFHPLITESIEQASARQYNYALHMSLPTQLSRWLHRYLILRFTHADHFKPFTVRYSTVKRDSRLLDKYGRERDGINKAEEAFRELVKNGILKSFDRSDDLGLRGKLLDVAFSVRPSSDFIKEAKAANMRRLQAQDEIARSKKGDRHNGRSRVL